MKKIFISFVLFSLLLASCGPGQLLGPTKTKTLTLTPTNTPTSTPTNTPTSTPTNTPTPTRTNTPTPTPTNTFTPAPTQIGGGNGKLIFELNRDDYESIFPDLEGQFHVFTANLDGTEIIPVTRRLNGHTRLIDVSPDGRNALIVSTPTDPVSDDVYTLYVVYLNEENSFPIEIAKLDEPASDFWMRGKVALWKDNKVYVYIGYGESGFGVYMSDGVGTKPKEIYRFEDLGDEYKPYRLLAITESRVYWTADILLRKEGNSSWHEERIWWSSLDGLDYGKLEYNGNQIAGSLLFSDDIAISPDGSKIAWYSLEEPWGLHIASIDEINNPTITRTCSNIIDLAWSPNASILMVYDDGCIDNDPESWDYMGLYEVILSPEFSVRDHSDSFVSIASSSDMCFDAIYEISPDGKNIILGPSEDGYARLLELDSFNVSKLLNEITFSLFCGTEKINWIP